MLGLNLQMMANCLVTRIVVHRRLRKTIKGSLLQYKPHVMPLRNPNQVSLSSNCSLSRTNNSPLVIPMCAGDLKRNLLPSLSCQVHKRNAYTLRNHHSQSKMTDTRWLPNRAFYQVLRHRPSHPAQAAL